MNNRDEFDDPKGSDFLGSVGPKAAFFIVLIALSFMIGVVWKLYVGGGSSDGQNVPIIRADTNPYKVEPDDPGGMKMPHKDSTIFSSLNSDPDADRGIENLLADDDDEEEPMPRSQLFAGLNTEPSPDLHAEAQETPLDRPLTEDEKRIVSQAKEAQKVVTNLLEDGVDAIDVADDDATENIVIPKKVEPVSPEVKTKTEEEIVQEQIKRDEELIAKAKEKSDAEAKKKAAVEKLAAEKEKAEAAKRAAAKKAKEKAAKEKAASQKPEPVAVPVQMGGDHYVQLASVQDKTRVESEWNKLKSKYGSVLSGYDYRVETANISKGTYYRIQAGPVSKAQATSTCNAIKRQDRNGCLVKKK